MTAWTRPILAHAQIQERFDAGCRQHAIAGFRAGIKYYTCLSKQSFMKTRSRTAIALRIFRTALVSSLLLERWHDLAHVLEHVAR